MSEVITDKLTGRATANDVTITVGASATMSLEQGVAKSWIKLNGTGTIADGGSLNVGSITDNGTGNYRFTYTNAFSGGGNSLQGTANAYHTQSYDNQTTYSELRTYGSAHTLIDPSRVHMAIFGDLA